MFRSWFDPWLLGGREMALHCSKASEGLSTALRLATRRYRTNRRSTRYVQSNVPAVLSKMQQVQAKQRELQSKLEAMLASVEDERLRPMRKQGFLAMAKCCDLSDPSASGVLAMSPR